MQILVPIHHPIAKKKKNKPGGRGESVGLAGYIVRR